MKENSIEEDIEIVEKFNKENRFRDCGKINNAIEHILSDYKRVLKENEELKELHIQENKKCMMLAIEKQDYFEKYRYHLQQNESLTKEFSNVISIQKVKDKIEELEKMKSKTFGINNTIVKSQIETLQELLESEEK